VSVWPPEDRPKPETRHALSEVSAWARVVEGYVENSRNLAARLEKEGQIDRSVEAHQAAADWQFRVDSLHRAIGILGAVEGNEAELRKIVKRSRERQAKAAGQGSAA
jgi:hypothetical protein